MDSQATAAPGQEIDPPSPENAASDGNIYDFLPLDPGSKQTRILLIHPGQQSEPVIAYLHRIDLEQKKGPYNALSYHWESDPRGDSEIYLGTFPSSPFQAGIAPRRITVSRTVDLALRRLRCGDRFAAIWIDALCIDQASSTDKAHQIPLMCDIYRGAETVFVWLGEFEHNTTLISRLGQWFDNQEASYDALWHGSLPGVDVSTSEILPIEIGPEDMAEDMAEDSMYDEEEDEERLLKKITWKSLEQQATEFFSKPWFRRTWVVQEVALAENIPQFLFEGQLTVSLDAIDELSQFLRFAIRQLPRTNSYAYIVTGLSRLQDIVMASDSVRGYYATRSLHRRVTTVRDTQYRTASRLRTFNALEMAYHHRLMPRHACHCLNS